MAADSGEFFRYVSRRWVGQIGAGGVADASTTTIPLSSATNLSTDTAVTVVIDRVDANGTATPSLEETVTGVVSGSNLITCNRGIEGTAQAHSAGAVVEVLITAAGWNDIVTGIIVGHSQFGYHSDGATTIVNTADPTKVIGWSLGGATTLKTLTLATAHTDNRTVTFPDATDTLVGKATTDTLTNKRITKRVTTITSHATPTINTDNCDAVTITALATAITSMTTNLSGTPTNFQTLIFRIKDDGTARAITWGASFEAKGVALPTTTVLSKVLTVGFMYDTVTSKWGCVASAQEA